MSSILAAAPVELHQATGWRPFVDTRSQTFYGFCVDEGCGDPWALHLPTGRLVQCGCPNFSIDPTQLGAELAGALTGIDLTPTPRPTAWRYFDQCDPFYGCGHQGGWYLDAIGRQIIGCPCGWSPLNLHPWEVGQ